MTSATRTASRWRETLVEIVVQRFCAEWYRNRRDTLAFNLALLLLEGDGLVPTDARRALEGALEEGVIELVRQVSVRRDEPPVSLSLNLGNERAVAALLDYAEGQHQATEAREMAWRRDAERRAEAEESQRHEHVPTRDEEGVPTGATVH